MADAVLGYAVQRIGDLLIDEAVFLSKVKDQVEWVKEELKTMQCFLKDADTKSKGGDDRVKEWVRQVREIAYQAEELVESYVLDAEQRRRRRKGSIRTIVCCRLPSPNDFIVRHRFGNEIEDIRGKIEEINKRKSTYGIKDLGEEPRRQIDETLRERRRVVLHAPDSDLVAMDKEEDRILGHLLDGSRKKRSVTSIVGMGGLGKTTLAKRVFKEAKASFSHSVWIDVSQQYSPEALLRDILRQVTGPGASEQMTRDECEAMLYQTLEAENYLIVMDDVWDTEAWRILSPHLPDAGNASRVLITTRSVDVARSADPSTPGLDLRFLTEEESWELLSKKAFPNHEDIEAVCSEPLRKVGEEIARKCGGLPLALVVLGGLLSTKDPSLGAWRRVAETLAWEKIKDGPVCLAILALSYEDLPPHLKWCFLYFSSLPEDFEIRVDKLIGLWIAEGFVEQRAGETLEETAEDYLEELVQRCMVIVVRSDSGRIIESPPLTEVRCRIHDLLHDLTVAEAKEVGFLVSHGIRDDEGVSQLDSSLRRLSLQGKKAWWWDSKSTPRLRTLLSFGFDGESDIKRTFPPIPDLKLLRVVVLEGAPIAELPEQVGDLIHLRYLGLRNTEIDSLPSSLGKLRHLQFLDAEGTRIVTMPRGVWKIAALRQVLVPPEVELNMVEAGLTSLQVLKLVRAGSWIDSCLGSLTSLRELLITGIEDCHLPGLSSGLPKLRRLKKLHLRGKWMPDRLWTTPSSFSSLQVLCLDGKVRRPPQQSISGGDQWPLNLTELTLYETGLGQDSIAALEKLPELKYLYLLGGSYEGNEMICSRGGFPKLETLGLYTLHELERWVIEAGAMPRLRILRISHCRKLAMLPEGLQQMAALKELDLMGMPLEIRSRAEKGGEDWPKIQHIPSIAIG